MERLDKIDEKLDRLSESFTRQETVLSEHMRRTALAEESISLIRQELHPIKVHVAVIGALGKVLGAVGTLIGIAVGVAKLLSI